LHRHDERNETQGGCTGSNGLNTGTLQVKQTINLTDSAVLVSELRYLPGERKIEMCRSSLHASVANCALFEQLDVALTENKVITAHKKASDGIRDVLP
jgi:hypothetical protein